MRRFVVFIVLCVLPLSVLSGEDSVTVVTDIVPYERSEYLYGWLDADNNCLDTRQEVLRAESLEPVVMGLDSCRVLSGKWLDAYSGKIYTDPRLLDIDHVIPLHEAHISGAYAWSKEKKKAFANDLSDPDALIAVSVGQNRSKRDRDPSLWMPMAKDYHCEYLRIWVHLKAKYQLTMDVREYNFISTHECMKDDNVIRPKG